MFSPSMVTVTAPEPFEVVIIARLYLESLSRSHNYSFLQEAAQREAFAKLFSEQDSKAQRLRREIGLIEKELCLLTVAEQNGRNERTENNQRMLKERRKELLELLIQLSRDQEKRQSELQQRLVSVRSCRSFSFLY